nr:hypothetical protein [Deltaproteobacteria bacterium]
MTPRSPGQLPATAALFALSLAARLAFGLLVRVPPAWDGVLYERGARGLARGLGYSCFLFGPSADPSVPTAFYPVGYPAFLGPLPPLRRLSADRRGERRAPRAITVALSHRLALRCGPALAAHGAALLFALAPGPVVFSVTPMSETLWGALLLATALVLARASSPPRVPSLLAAGALLAAAVYVRPQALVLVPLLPALLPGTLPQRLRRAAWSPRPWPRSSPRGRRATASPSTAAPS